MTKTLTYSAFAVASLIAILIFLTANTYYQLAAAAVLYPGLVFLGLMIFPRKRLMSPKITMHALPKLNQERVETSKPKTESAYTIDIDRRAFIKLIGAAGISFFLLSILGRGIETLIFGRIAQPGIIPTGDGNQVSSAQGSPTDGYKISEIDEGPVSYYGFINKDGAWLIMREDSNESNFRYAKGDSNFPNNWSNRENLRYDYFYNLF